MLGVVLGNREGNPKMGASSASLGSWHLSGVGLRVEVSQWGQYTHHTLYCLRGAGVHWEIWTPDRSENN